MFKLLILIISLLNGVLSAVTGTSALAAAVQRAADSFSKKEELKCGNKETCVLENGAIDTASYLWMFMNFHLDSKRPQMEAITAWNENLRAALEAETSGVLETKNKEKYLSVFSNEGHKSVQTLLISGFLKQELYPSLTQILKTDLSVEESQIVNGEFRITFREGSSIAEIESLIASFGRAIKTKPDATTKVADTVVNLKLPAKADRLKLISAFQKSDVVTVSEEESGAENIFKAVIPESLASITKHLGLFILSRIQSVNPGDTSTEIEFRTDSNTLIATVENEASRHAMQTNNNKYLALSDLGYPKWRIRFEDDSKEIQTETVFTREILSKLKHEAGIYINAEQSKELNEIFSKACGYLKLRCTKLLNPMKPAAHSKMNYVEVAIPGFATVQDLQWYQTEIDVSICQRFIEGHLIVRITNGSRSVEKFYFSVIRRDLAHNLEWLRKLASDSAVFAGEIIYKYSVNRVLVSGSLTESYIQRPDHVIAAISAITSDWNNLHQPEDSRILVRIPKSMQPFDSNKTVSNLKEHEFTFLNVRGSRDNEIQLFFRGVDPSDINSKLISPILKSLVNTPDIKQQPTLKIQIFSEKIETVPLFIARKGYWEKDDIFNILVPAPDAAPDWKIYKPVEWYFELPKKTPQLVTNALFDFAKKESIDADLRYGAASLTLSPRSFLVQLVPAKDKVPPMHFPNIYKLAQKLSAIQDNLGIVFLIAPAVPLMQISASVFSKVTIDQIRTDILQTMMQPLGIGVSWAVGAKAGDRFRFQTVPNKNPPQKAAVPQARQNDAETVINLIDKLKDLSPKIIEAFKGWEALTALAEGQQALLIQYGSQIRPDIGIEIRLKIEDVMNHGGFENQFIQENINSAYQVILVKVPDELAKDERLIRELIHSTIEAHQMNDPIYLVTQRIKTEQVLALGLSGSSPLAKSMETSVDELLPHEIVDQRLKSGDSFYDGQSVQDQNSIFRAGLDLLLRGDNFEFDGRKIKDLTRSLEVKKLLKDYTSHLRTEKVPPRVSPQTTPAIVLSSSSLPEPMATGIPARFEELLESKYKIVKKSEAIYSDFPVFLVEIPEEWGPSEFFIREAIVKSIEELSPVVPINVIIQSLEKDRLYALGVVGGAPVARLFQNRIHQFFHPETAEKRMRSTGTEALYVEADCDQAQMKTLRLAMTQNTPSTYGLLELTKHTSPAVMDLISAYHGELKLAEMHKMQLLESNPSQRMKLNIPGHQVSDPINKAFNQQIQTLGQLRPKTIIQKTPRRESKPQQTSLKEYPVQPHQAKNTVDHRALDTGSAKIRNLLEKPTADSNKSVNERSQQKMGTPLIHLTHKESELAGLVRLSKSVAQTRPHDRTDRQIPQKKPVLAENLASPIENRVSGAAASDPHNQAVRESRNNEILQQALIQSHNEGRRPDCGIRGTVQPHPTATVIMSYPYQGQNLSPKEGEPTKFEVSDGMAYQTQTQQPKTFQLGIAVNATSPIDNQSLRLSRPVVRKPKESVATSKPNNRDRTPPTKISQTIKESSPIPSPLKATIQPKKEHRELSPAQFIPNGPAQPNYQPSEHLSVKRSRAHITSGTPESIESLDQPQNPAFSDRQPARIEPPSITAPQTTIQQSNRDSHHTRNLSQSQVTPMQSEINVRRRIYPSHETERSPSAQKEQIKQETGTQRSHHIRTVIRAHEGRQFKAPESKNDQLPDPNEATKQLSLAMRGGQPEVTQKLPEKEPERMPSESPSDPQHDPAQQKHIQTPASTNNPYIPKRPSQPTDLPELTKAVTAGSGIRPEKTSQDQLEFVSDRVHSKEEKLREEDHYIEEPQFPEASSVTKQNQPPDVVPSASNVAPRNADTPIPCTDNRENLKLTTHNSTGALQGYKLRNIVEKSGPHNTVPTLPLIGSNQVDPCISQNSDQPLKPLSVHVQPSSQTKLANAEPQPHISDKSQSLLESLKDLEKISNLIEAADASSERTEEKNKLGNLRRGNHAFAFSLIGGILLVLAVIIILLRF